MGYNIGVATNVVKTALDKVFFTEFDYEKMPGFTDALDPMAFMQESTDRNAVISEQLQSIGYWETRAEQQNVPEKSARVGNQKTSTVLNYSASLDISKNMFDDDQHSTVNKLVRDFARTARLTRDRNAFQVFNLGFTTQTTNDGVALFSNSHLALNGDTVDNLASGALSDTNLETAINLLVEQKTQDGTLGSHQPTCLLVPPPLFKEATIITKSELRSGTANNDLNYYSTVYPTLTVKQTPYLGATNGLSGSDTAWFLLSQNHGIYRYQRQAVNTDLVDYKFQRNNNYIYKGEYREINDTIVFEGAVASTGV